MAQCSRPVLHAWNTVVAVGCTGQRPVLSQRLSHKLWRWTVNPQSVYVRKSGMRVRRWFFLIELRIPPL